ncbi:TPA: tyrosine-type recombinase/integrase [Burkholderia vietnamiensis]|nr:tyrosine-type recombinase/integrase [Burkholderia vietnamiensis]
MPIKTPRLHRDRKSGGYFFRYKLPAILAERLGKVSVYQSLKTKDFALAKARALYLNLQLEMSRHKLNPHNIKLDDVRELLRIDVKNGIFEADTAEEAAQGLKVLEAMKGAYGRPVTIDEIGVFSSETHRTESAPPPQAAVPPKHTSSKLSVVIEEYFRDARLTLADSTQYKHQQTFKRFLAEQGDRPADDYSHEDIKTFKNRLLDTGNTGHTINQYLSAVRTLFGFAIKNKHYHQSNPVDGLMIAGAKKVTTPRENFSHDELKAIYKWENYQWLALKPDYFWGPLICLFSGIRIEEATSLELKDIKETDGVVFFKIKDAKTRSGNRSVPIHSTLIELGLLEYIETVRTAGHDKLFWYLVDGHNGTKKNLSRRFSLYLDRLKIKEDSNCFHSLRHTTISRLAGCGVNNSLNYLLTGHVSEEEAKSAHWEYLHDQPMVVMHKAIEKLDYQNFLDLKGFDYKPSLQNVLSKHSRT